MTVSKHIKSVLILLCKDLIIRNLHNITDSADGADCHIDLQVVKFPPQEGNIYFHIIVFCIGIESPDFCGNLVFLENLITVIHKKFQQLHFFSRYLDRFLGLCVADFAGSGIVGEISNDRV